MNDFDKICQKKKRTYINLKQHAFDVYSVYALLLLTLMCTLYTVNNVQRFSKTTIVH